MITINGIKMYGEAELAALWGVSQCTIARYRKAGNLRATRLGGKFYYTESAVKTYLNGKYAKIRLSPKVPPQR